MINNSPSHFDAAKRDSRYMGYAVQKAEPKLSSSAPRLGAKDEKLTLRKCYPWPHKGKSHMISYELVNRINDG
jgi:hypothetical protein